MATVTGAGNQDGPGAKHRGSSALGVSKIRSPNMDPE